MQVLVAVNDAGQRIGEYHPQAKMSDREVELFLSLRDEGWSYQQLADKFEISKSQARNICKGYKRCQVPASWKMVKVGEVV